jgi:hypothetical protein
MAITKMASITTSSHIGPLATVGVMKHTSFSLKYPQSTKNVDYNSFQRFEGV